MPPHFWTTVDKGTPSRITNQAILIIARNNDGKPCPIPVAAPAVYKKLAGAPYGHLAQQICPYCLLKLSNKVCKLFIILTVTQHPFLLSKVCIKLQIV